MYGTSPPKIYTLSLTTLFRSRVSVTTDVTYELTRSRSPTARAWRRPGILQVSGPTATPFPEASIRAGPGDPSGRAANPQPQGTRGPEPRRPRSDSSRHNPRDTVAPAQRAVSRPRAGPPPQTPQQIR